MIKIFNAFCLILLSLLFIQNANCQTYSIGGGVAYNNTLEIPGLNLRAYKNIGESFCFGTEFGIFLPKETIEGDKKEDKFVWEVNLVTHYVFELKEKIGIYPVLGLNYTREKETIEYLSSGETEEATIDAIGFNMGAGIHYPVKHVTPFAEYAYVTGTLSEHAVIVGLFFTIGKNSEENEKHHAE